MGELLALAFATGMLSTVNPCGFAMLPGFLAFSIGATDGSSGGPAGASTAASTAESADGSPHVSPGAAGFQSSSRASWGSAARSPLWDGLVAGAGLSAGFAAVFTVAGLLLAVGLRTVIGA
ncbi:MAG: hypothetical protein M3P83_07615, partial [Actinomycetota bacterium]|nr:hypothetical protein [Actinomycetota bacterium]